METSWSSLVLGEILLLGDFNARTGNEQTRLLDLDDPILLREMDIEDTGLQRSSQDSGNITSYGRDLLDMGAAHGLVIFNGLARWPLSGHLTCFPHGGGSSTVDYLIGSPTLIPQIPDFSIPPPPLGADHTYLAFTITSIPPSPTTSPTHHPLY